MTERKWMSFKEKIVQLLRTNEIEEGENKWFLKRTDPREIKEHKNTIFWKFRWVCLYLKTVRTRFSSTSEGFLSRFFPLWAKSNESYVVWEENTGEKEEKGVIPSRILAVDISKREIQDAFIIFIVRTDEYKKSYVYLVILMRNSCCMCFRKCRWSKIFTHILHYMK